jgi:hypothetical protein
LYAQIHNHNASFPVIDYIAKTNNHDVNAELDRPDFLFTDTGRYRIVEFYVHWYDGVAALFFHLFVSFFSRDS